MGRPVPQVLRGRAVAPPQGDAVAAARIVPVPAALPVSPAPRAASAERIAIVDALRLLSILLVLAIHLFVPGILAPTSPALDRAWAYFARNGSYGVTLFFVISGYVITRTVLRRDRYPGAVDVRGFYARRAGRILPLLLAVIAVGALVMAATSAGSPARQFTLRQPQAAFDAAFWISLVTFSFNWLRIAREQVAFGFGLHWDVMWSLAIEEQFYLCYPLLLRFTGTPRRLALALTTVVALGPLSRFAAEQVRPGSFLLSFTNSFAAFEQIALGALLCLLLERHARTPVRAWEALLGLLGGVGMVAVYVLSSLADARDRLWAPTLLALCACAFLGAGIRRDWMASGWPSRLSVLGQFSYSGYLLHSLVLLVMWPLLQGRHALLAFVLYASATLLAAGAVYHGFEMPANQWVRRRLRAR